MTKAILTMKTDTVSWNCPMLVTVESAEEENAP